MCKWQIKLMEFKNLPNVPASMLSNVQNRGFLPPECTDYTVYSPLTHGMHF